MRTAYFLNSPEPDRAGVVSITGRRVDVRLMHEDKPATVFHDADRRNVAALLRCLRGDGWTMKRFRHID